MSFADDDLALIEAAEEVTIETQAPDRPARKTVIWVVVDDGEVYVRSVRGEQGRWYQACVANSTVAVIVDGKRLVATAIPANDPDSIDRVSAALERKYARDPGLKPMLKPEALETTLRLEPA
jgi:hypothetical protein